MASASDFFFNLFLLFVLLLIFLSLLSPEPAAFQALTASDVVLPAPAPTPVSAPALLAVSQSAPQDALADLAALPADVTNHAYEKHGQDAQIAISFVRAIDARHCRFRCPREDGERTFYACPMPDGRLAVVIHKADIIITAFLTRSQNWVNNALRGCYAW